MPFLALVHLKALPCATCGELLAPAGARSFVVDEDGNPVDFPADRAPEEMVVDIHCAHGHETMLYVPNEIGAEEALLTPEDAPIGRDAILRD